MNWSRHQRPVRPTAGHLALLLLLGLCMGVGLWPGPAPAQTNLDYNLLFGSGDKEEGTAASGNASQPASNPTSAQQSRPSQSRSSQSGGQGGVLTLSADDYARVAQNAPKQMASATQKAVKLFRQRLIGIVKRSPQAFDDVSTTLAAASPTGHGIYFLGIAIFASLLIVVGQAVNAFYINFVARPIFVRMQARTLHGYADKVPVLASRVLQTFIGLADRAIGRDRCWFVLL